MRKSPRDGHRGSLGAGADLQALHGLIAVEVHGALARPSDPAVDSFVSTVGEDAGAGSGLHLRLLPEAAERAPRQRHGGRQSPASQAGASRGRQPPPLKPAQDINVGGRQSQGLFQYTLQCADSGELTKWSAKLFDKMKPISYIRISVELTRC